MTWPSAQDRVECDDPGAGDQRGSPIRADAARKLVATVGIPCLWFLRKSGRQGLLTPVVQGRGQPCRTSRGRAAAVFLGHQCRWRVPRPENIQALQTGHPLGPGIAACILQRAAKLPLIQVLDTANREDADGEGRVDQDIVDELGRDGQAVEREDLHIPQDIESAETGEDAAQRTRVEAVAR